jgi:antitoxin (DNA-binding transcriptional repressor) of toxin-antitoxin stability system
MKTASVRDLRQNFPRVMAWIADGEQVAVTMRRKVIARLVPEKPASPSRPDFRARFGKAAPAGGKLAQSAVNLLSQERGA